MTTSRSPITPGIPSPGSITEIVLPGLVPPSGLQVRRRTLPAPAAGQALVRVEASGVSFAEQAMRRGRYPGQPTFPFVPGYDLVGTVQAVGPGVRLDLAGRRVAAVTKTGAWATHILLPARTLVPLPASIDPALAETVIVNGITAWQMLYRKARVRAGQTILVHGANGGVATILVQLARHSGVRVIGTASPRHHDTLRALGVEPVDYRDPHLAAQIRDLAPDGVDAAFDHLGGQSVHASYGLLARGGTLVAYGIASGLDDAGSIIPTFLALLTRLTVWNTLPNAHRALFYNFWAGRLIRPAAFRRRLHDDLTQVLRLVSAGVITPQIAGRFALTEAARALELAESHTTPGKVVLLP